jgi:2,4-dienoyl-CoA reductase-like NADH-dependent reductase (Old Yellow Enzyme family)
MRYPQIKRLDTVAALRDRLDELGVQVPLDDHVDPAGVLATPVPIVDAGAGVLTLANRFAVLPMEGWDGTTEGAPTELVRRRWSRFGASGCGLVWCEATAVRPDGRANPNQLMLNPATVDDFAALRRLLDPSQVAVLQLTHSGRWSRPHGTPSPRTAYEHPVLDARVGAGAAEVLRDDELDELVDAYVDAAVLAAQTGFEMVDVKHCHGYLLHELLSATGVGGGEDGRGGDGRGDGGGGRGGEGGGSRGDDARSGSYRGSFEARTAFLRAVVAGIRDRAPSLGIAVRLSAFDFVPFTTGPDGTGVPDPLAAPAATTGARYSHAFGGDGTGLGIDLTETHAFFELLETLGVGLVSVTAASPYYNPHVQRPAYFPPSDGYQPPEDPLVGVARQLAVTAELTRAHPGVTVVGSGYSYLQDWLPHVAQAVVAGGGADVVGLGRMVLSYPDLAADVLAGRPLQTRQICRTFSDCTTAPRNGLVSGCFPLDPFYKDHPQRVELAAAKRTAAARFRPR